MSSPHGPQGFSGQPGPSQGPAQPPPPQQQQAPQPGQFAQHAPTQQFHTAAQPGPGAPAVQRPPMPRVILAIWVLGLVSVAGVVIGLSVEENGANGWDSVNAWGGLAIVGALLTLAPALGQSANLGAQRAWQLAACGAAALILFWVLFVLPAVGSNTSLVVTIGVAAGVIAWWIAPGPGAVPGATPRQDQHTW